MMDMTGTVSDGGGGGGGWGESYLVPNGNH